MSPHRILRDQPLASRSPWSWRRMLAIGVVTLSVLYLVYLVLPDLEAVQALIARLGMAQLALAVALGIVMFLTSAWYNAHLLRRIGGNSVDVRGVLASYLQAQLVRYLPGKVWGLVYQTRQLSGSIPPRQVVLANVSQMLMTNLAAAGVIAAILAAAWLNAQWPLLGAVAWMCIIELMHRRPLLEHWAMRKAVRLLPSKFGSLGTTTIARSKWVATAILALEWLLYFAMILALLHGMVGTLDAMVLAAWYAAASMLALVAVVVPAGIAVREAIFVTAAPLLPLDSASLVAIAALLRVCSIAAEVLAAALGTAILSVTNDAR